MIVKVKDSKSKYPIVDKQTNSAYTVGCRQAKRFQKAWLRQCSKPG